ncbi:hypothetical protein H4R34_003546 [Dimargaris verticillata]|uniref:Large ribosomal subunit protein mL59 domain-containing protein n=1 Tax=Dimargaris verticillata TaxID=2761393 RepID=A0A9W8ED21_9FUNG|nr:hypothetical protein H4R34_003546 [Dimargaris verticillata]
MASVRRFSQKLCDKLNKSWDLSDFRAQFVNGYWRTSRVSLRQQADIRKLCLVKGIDPTSIGLPTLAERKVLRVKPPKGHKPERTKVMRQGNIDVALKNMPKTIADWKKSKEVAKAKEKPVLPY